jgi:hypothetical protein
MKENKNSKITRKRQMLFIRKENLWTVPVLEDILQAAYKFTRNTCKQ